MTGRSWLRRNGLWLLGLPVALALAIAGNAHRVETYWWDNGFHQEVAAGEQGRWVDVADKFVDPHGTGKRHFSVKLVGLEEIDEVPIKFSDPASPRGTQGYLVELAFRAKPGEPMLNCVISVVDTEGREYGGQNDEIDRDAGCVPADAPGPVLAYKKEQPRGAVGDGPRRPDEWTVKLPVLVREDARLAELRLMWEWNDYTTLRFDEETDDGR